MMIMYDLSSLIKMTYAKNWGEEEDATSYLFSNYITIGYNSLDEEASSMTTYMYENAIELSLSLSAVQVFPS